MPANDTYTSVSLPLAFAKELRADADKLTKTQSRLKPVSMAEMIATAYAFYKNAGSTELASGSTISVTDEEYAFLKDFTDALSQQEGFKLRMAQALIKAAIQYQVKNGLRNEPRRALPAD